MKRLVPSPQKLVAFLQDEIGEVCSGKFIRRVLEANLCRVNGLIERFGSTQLKRGDVVELAPAWKSVAAPSRPAGFPTLYEDDSARWIDKPAGWVCSEENCRQAFGGALKLIHRLDKDTTGVLGLAKGGKSRDAWMDLFAKREVEKKYLAIVDGIPKESKGVRETYLSRKKTFQGQTIWGSGPKGLHAVTHWQVLAVGKQASLLLCQPVTGRTHQIRVHLAEIGHPILVDRQYSDRFRSPLFALRPLLHAFQLRTSGISVEAPLPLDMRQAILRLDMEVGHLHQFFSGEQHDDGGDERQDDEDAEEVEERTHLLH